MADEIEERASFSRRLRLSLQAAQYTPDSPTQVARNFNLRSKGRQVTVHAVRKWLVGEAIPTQEKLRTLAEWLAVPIEWLRFGSGSCILVTAETKADKPVSSSELRLIADLQHLDDHHRQMVHDFVAILIKANCRLQRQMENQVRIHMVVAGDKQSFRGSDNERADVVPTEMDQSMISTG